MCLFLLFILNLIELIVLNERMVDNVESSAS